MHATLVSRQRASYDVRFWLWWVVATMLGWSGGIWYGFFLGILAPSNVTVALAVGVAVGLLQWLVFRAEAVEVPRLAWWAPAGAVGLVLPVGLARLIWGEPEGAGWLVAAVVGGALAGALQQGILRQALPHSWWWAPASAAGWGLAMLAFAAPSLVVHAGPETVGVWSPFSLLMDFVPGLMVGATTGTALTWLRRQIASASASQARPAAPPDPIWRRRLVGGMLVAALPFLFISLPSVVSMSRYMSTVPREYRALTLSDAAFRARAIAFSPDGSRLVTCSPDLGAALIDRATGHVLLTLPGAFTASDGMMADVAFSPNGTLLVTADIVHPGPPDMPLPTPNDATVRLWDAATGAEVRAFPGQERGVSRVAFSPDNTLLAVAVADGTWSVKLLDVATGAAVRTLKAPMPITDLAFSPDGALLATSSVDGVVTLWDVASGTVRRSIAGPAIENEDPGSRIAFSPNGATLAVAGSKIIQLRDVATGALLHTLEGHGDQVWWAAFSPDGRLLATASDDKTVRLWDVATGVAVRVLEGHAWWVRGVAFSPDGTALASASFDGTVKLWDVTTGAELRSIAWPGTS
ncbi:MAG: WD40 repeat domain-containing protein [Chloroflexales bacterium]|nr:WD40 repeat domain-containing protein [Chloroflexales bacterium]